MYLILFGSLALLFNVVMGSRYNPSFTLLFEEESIFVNYGVRYWFNPAYLPKRRHLHSSTSVGSKMFIFGGYDGSGDEWNDMWCYDAELEMWAWVSGSPGVCCGTSIGGAVGEFGYTYTPEAKIGASMWISDDKKSIYLVGGCVYTDVGFSGGTWQYDLTLGQWAKSSSSGEEKYCFQTYQRNEWGGVFFFGGVKNSGFQLNDLDEFNETTMEMALVKSGGGGSAHGEKGKFDEDYYPAARYGAVSWYQGNGDRLISQGGTFFVFGGRDYILGRFSDVWAFVRNETHALWGWIAGTDDPDDYESQKMGAEMFMFNGQKNNPHSKAFACSWVNSNNVDEGFVFGGGHNRGSSLSTSELWIFSMSRGEWKWISGEYMIEFYSTPYHEVRRRYGHSCEQLIVNGTISTYIFGGKTGTSTAKDYLYRFDDFHPNATCFNETGTCKGLPRIGSYVTTTTITKQLGDRGFHTAEELLSIGFLDDFDEFLTTNVSSGYGTDSITWLGDQGFLRLHDLEDLGYRNVTSLVGMGMALNFTTFFSVDGSEESRTLLDWLNERRFATIDELYGEGFVNGSLLEKALFGYVTKSLLFGLGYFNSSDQLLDLGYRTPAELVNEGFINSSSLIYELGYRTIDQIKELGYKLDYELLQDGFVNSSFQVFTMGFRTLTQLQDLGDDVLDENLGYFHFWKKRKIFFKICWLEKVEV